MIQRFPIECYKKGLIIIKKLTEETGAIEAKQNLAVSYSNLGDLQEARGDLTGAEEYYKKSLEIRGQLAEETGTAEARQDLAVSYNALGDIQVAQGNFLNAKENYQMALLITEQLLSERDNNQEQINVIIKIAESYWKIGNIQKKQKKHNDAAISFQYQLRICKQLLAEIRTISIYRELLLACDAFCKYMKFYHIFGICGK